MAGCHNDHAYLLVASVITVPSKLNLLWLFKRGTLFCNLYSKKSWLQSNIFHLNYRSQGELSAAMIKYAKVCRVTPRTDVGAGSKIQSIIRSVVMEKRRFHSDYSLPDFSFCPS